MIIGLGHYLTVAAMPIYPWHASAIFLNRKNVIIILMSIELMLLAVNINLGRILCTISEILWGRYSHCSS